MAGMDCGEEVSLLRARLSKVRGVRELHFDAMQGRMEVEYAQEMVTPAEIEAAVESVGMKCEPWAQPKETRREWQDVRLWISGVALAAGMAYEVAVTGEVIETLFVHGHTGGGHEHGLPGVAVALFSAAIIAGAAGAWKKAWASLHLFRPDMNLLVVLSIAGAASLGEWVEAATLAFLFSLAGKLESASLRYARDSVAKLLAVAPAEAAVVHGDHEHRVMVESVAVGSRVRVRAGERIPCDGEVAQGRSLVNQAFVTGESVAVEKSEGDEVFAGTLNESGTLEIRTTRASKDTTVARMLRMIEESRHRKAPSEQMVERFARRYTPAVLAVAGAVALLPPLAMGHSWQLWAYRAMLVLLISCPCALVISTPVSVVAALASAAREGVLIKGGAYLEEAARLHALALDRQGLLTMGKPEAARRIALDQEAARQLGAWENWRIEQGEGYSLTPLRAVESGLQGKAAEAVETLAREGYTVSIAEQGGRKELVGLCDSPRPDAAAVLKELRALGIEHVALLTGDPQPVAELAGRTAGVDEIRAELRPEEKATRIEALIGQHGSVAMAGDCSADARALAAASLGISLGLAGPEIVRESADVVVMGNDFAKLLFLIRHARRTRAVIGQNIAVALGMKALFLACTLLGVASLWMAVAADMGATVAVTLNGLRLLRAVPHQTK
ncbi:MAG: cadmium-translocating P-type ATPase [Acidobacteria bacterium]|nr:cadmium-translocating P-type ATPase [Acidobacteriota bacterium]